MAEVINEIISTVLQIIFFALIPFVFFLFRKQKSISFFQYTGLYKPSGKSIVLSVSISLLFVITGIGLTFIDNDIKQAVLSPNSVTGKLRLSGFNANTIFILLIIAIFKTSLAEEIFFRGFIGKNVVAAFGFKSGNILQALIFGFLHLVLFAKLISAAIFPLLFIFVFSMFAGWLIGFVKEKYANGSIVPGWVAHGLGNTVSYFLIAFVI